MESRYCELVDAMIESCRSAAEFARTASSEEGGLARARQRVLTWETQVAKLAEPLA